MKMSDFAWGILSRICDLPITGVLQKVEEVFDRTNL